ncbi:MAG: cell envelope integrity protein CreD [Prevotella sp.]|nr:cell envelope integrity protein CreD [Prevotella sp.]
METSKLKFTQSLTFKGIVTAILVLLLLIPCAMVQELITERQQRSAETILKINDKWSRPQTLCAPLLVIPYTTTQLDKDKKTYYEEHSLFVTPQNLKIDVSLTPEERHYGIYKTILYKSGIRFSGDFAGIENLKIDNSELHFDKAYIAIGITDLRGVSKNPEFTIANKPLAASVGVVKLFEVAEPVVVTVPDKFSSDFSYSTDKITAGKTLTVNLKGLICPDSLQKQLDFACNLNLNGSSSIHFIPVGQNTAVGVEGEWESPSFVGNFSPEYSILGNHFSAAWNVLSYNREIPESWNDENVPALGDNSFGINLIETIDHYRQNMRSAKYALMFIALTFVVFFFVEIFTKKSIHFFQYLLVGIALILFYSLLLSLSEQIGFGLAYLIAGASTVLLITLYFYSLIRQKLSACILAGILTLLYAFLYVILQVEDFALLIGSVFLFVILGIIMFVSNKVKSK